MEFFLLLLPISPLFSTTRIFLKKNPLLRRFFFIRSLHTFSSHFAFICECRLYFRPFSQIPGCYPSYRFTTIFLFHDFPRFFSRLFFYTRILMCIDVLELDLLTIFSSSFSISSHKNTNSTGTSSNSTPVLCWLFNKLSGGYLYL